MDNDGYLLELSRYIHNNPVRVGIVKEPREYRWSSYNIYTGRVKDKYGLIDKGGILAKYWGGKQEPSPLALARGLNDFLEAV